jgi:hypothetical protein
MLDGEGSQTSGVHKKEHMQFLMASKDKREYGRVILASFSTIS